MATQDTSPVATLMSDLGIGSDESTPVLEEESNNTTVENNLSDSDTPTLKEDGEKSETSVETETAKADTDTIDDRLAKLEAELEKANKRISDKDRYINELKQGKQEKPEEELVEAADEEVDFWDDPVGQFKKISEQLRIANLRIDEQAYASDKSDYWKIVNAKNIQDAFKEDATFMNDFQTSSKPYEVAYEYLKAQQETKQLSEKTSKEKLKEELRQELLKEMGIKDTPKKEAPPSINNVGSSSSTKKDIPEDGFAAVFGSSY